MAAARVALRAYLATEENAPLRALETAARRAGTPLLFDETEVSLGYGWLLRGTYGLMALGALVAGLRYDPAIVRDVASAGVAIAAGVALWVSVARRSAGVQLQRERTQARSARVEQMTGIEETDLDAVR